MSDTFDRLAEPGAMPPEALERLVYLVGSARGGTSLSLHMFGAHRHVSSFIGPSHFYNQIWRYRKAVHERVLRVLFWAGLSTDQDRLFESLSEPQRDAAHTLYARGFTNPSMRGLYDLYALFRALDPDIEHPADGYRAWFDKSNDANGLEEIAAAYPQARFLFVFRDPRGAVPTLTTRAAMQSAQSEKLALGGVVAQSIYWRNLSQRCLRFAGKFPDRSLLLSYERLVTEPETVLSEVFSFAGLDPMTPDEMQKLASTIGFGSTYEAQSVGLNPAPITRWRTRVPEEVIDVISAICAPTASKLGYDIAAPEKGAGLSALLDHVPGNKAKAVTLAKLTYLKARELSGRLRPGAYARPPLLWSPKKDAALVAATAED